MFGVPPQAGYGTLSVSGYLRGRRPLSASRLVHVCGWGDFQLSQITAPSDPHPLTARRPAGADQAMTEAAEPVLSRADPATQVSEGRRPHNHCSASVASFVSRNTTTSACPFRLVTLCYLKRLSLLLPIAVIFQMPG